METTFEGHCQKQYAGNSLQKQRSQAPCKRQYAGRFLHKQRSQVQRKRQSAGSSLHRKRSQVHCKRQYAGRFLHKTALAGATEETITLRFLESAERTPAHSVRQRHGAPFCSQIHSTSRSVRLMFLDLVPNALICHDANLLASIQLVEATQIHFAVEQRFDVWIKSLPISICITKLRVSGWTR